MDASIIIPSYMSDATIERCLQALVSQDAALTYEIIVVDDGSTDNTREVVQGFHDDRTRYHYQENQGEYSGSHKKAKAK